MRQICACHDGVRQVGFGNADTMEIASAEIDVSGIEDGDGVGSGNGCLWIAFGAFDECK